MKLILTGLLLAAAALGQQTLVVVPQVELAEPSNPVRTQLPRGSGTMGSFACDANGAVYVEPQFTADRDTTSRAGSAIVRINPDGSIARFSPNTANGDHATYVLQHAVDRDGRVYLLTGRPGRGQKLAVQQLLEDSSVASTTDLDREFTPNLFVVLPSGNFLVGGTARSGEKESQTSSSVLWLFGRDGTFQREFLAIKSKTDAKPKAAADSSSASAFASLQVGDDNNIYVLTSGTPARVTVFNDAGEKQRTLKLEVPTQARADKIFFVGGGRLVVPYWVGGTNDDGQHTVKRIFRTYDAQTGIAEVDYVNTFRGLPACLDNNDLLFLMTGKDGEISVARASLR